MRICTFIPVKIAFHIDRLSDFKRLDRLIDIRARLRQIGLDRERVYRIVCTALGCLEIEVISL